MAKKNRNKGRSVNVNMEGVETGVLVPEGDYTVLVEEVTQETSDNSGKQYLAWKFKVEDEGSSKGSTLFYNTSLQPQALFNLKGVLISLGISVPDSTLKLDLDELEGLSCGVTVEHETFEGKKKSRIVDFFPLDDGSEDDDDETNLAEMDLDELLEYAKKEEIDLSSLSKKDKKKVDKVRAAIQEFIDSQGGDDNENDDNTEDDDDNEPDLDSMSLEELLSYAKEEEIDLSSLSKKDLKKVGKVREVIREALDEEDDDVDPDSMTLQEMLDYAKEEEIDLGLSKKDMKKEVKVRAALKKALEEEDV